MLDKSCAPKFSKRKDGESSHRNAFLGGGMFGGSSDAFLFLLCSLSGEPLLMEV